MTGDSELVTHDHRAARPPFLNLSNLAPHEEDAVRMRSSVRRSVWPTMSGYRDGSTEVG